MADGNGKHGEDELRERECDSHPHSQREGDREREGVREGELMC